MVRTPKIIAGIVFLITFSLIICLPVYAEILSNKPHIKYSGSKNGHCIEYSDETKQLMKEAGLETDTDWEEINRRQLELKKQKSNKNSFKASGEDEKITAPTRNYGTKYSYDEFHTAPTDIPANDGYKSGSFDELHINENFRQNVWHPQNRGGRLNGFDEFHYPDEL